MRIDYFCMCLVRESGESGAIELYCDISISNGDAHTPQAPRHTIITKLPLHGTLYRQTETKLASSDKNAARTHKRTHRDEKATKPQPCAHVRMGDTQKNPPVHPESGIVHDWLIYKQREKRYMQICDESELTRSSREERGLRQTPAPGPWASS